MAKSIPNYQILVSCPSDVQIEQQCLMKLIDELNSQYKNFDIRINYVHWSENILYGAGNPQGQINQQIVDSSDAIIALFATKFGSPTEKYDSGTLEEISKMIDNGKQVWVCFSNKSYPIGNINSDDLIKINNFKLKYGKEGLYITYDSDEELMRKITNQFNLWIPKLIEKEKTSDDKPNGGFEEVGIVKWSPQRGTSENFKNILANVEYSVDFLVSWGGSIPGLSSYWQRDLTRMLNKGISIRILLIKPGSRAEEKRRSDGAEWVSGDIERTIRELLAVKNERINPLNKINFNIGVYSTEAIWSMCFVDNKFASIGFYGTGTGRDHPSLDLKIIREKETFFDAFKNQFEAIWRERSLIHTNRDLDRIISENVKRKGDGIIYALTGPSGSGKTTLSKLLLSSLSPKAESIFTYTTRKQRNPKESEKQYKFITKEDFEKMEKNDEFVVISEYCDNKYAIRREEVFNVIDNKKDLVLDTIAEPDKLKKEFGNRVVIIYLTTSDYNLMRTRISKRMENNEDEIGMRIKNAKIQSTYASICDYVLFTDNDTEICLQDLLLITNESKNTYISSGVTSSDKITQFLSSVVIEEGRLPDAGNVN